VREISFAFGRTDKPITWRAGGGESVKLVFLIAVPATEPAQYLLLIAGLAGLSRDALLFERLQREDDPDQIMQAFQRIHLKSSPASATLKRAGRR
jgi:mannitol/fructose-specific phosphotransferase system IIA component (Ntr-type)